ncbi:MAG: methionyl-tRNA formyltransferase [Alphaproteobacteria bacterium]|nr:methionyl-tRNA formyltransferase [Alphaproteobacteria bacterium]
MKLVLMGTNAFVVPIFDAIKNAGHEIMAVFTRAPKPMGRKKVLTPSPVHAWAETNGLCVHTNINEYDYSPDMVVVISYGVILRDNVLSSAPVINIHPSPLPKYRGASPIRTAIYNGDKESAVCLMSVTPELDAGDVFICREFEIGIDDTNETIENRVSEIGADILVEYLKNPAAYPAHPQMGTPTYTRKWTGADEIIDWLRTPYEIHNQVRALGCGRTKINGIDVKILATKMVGNNLEILRVQPAGKTPMDWRSFVNGLHGAAIKYGEKNESEK